MSAEDAAVDYKRSRIKQYHKEGRALRTETTIHDTRDFGVGKRLNRRHTLQAFEVVGRNQRRAAQLLGVDRKTPPGKLARYGARESSRRGGQGRRR